MSKTRSTQRRKRSDENEDTHLFTPAPSSSATVLNTICNGDTCVRVPKTVSQPVNPFSMPATSSTDMTEHLDDVLESSYVDAIKESFKFGCLYGFIQATPTTVLDDFYRRNHFTPRQIALANQTIKALTVVGIAQMLNMLDPFSSALIISSPFISEALHYFLGVSDAIAQAAPTATMAVVKVVTDRHNIGTTLSSIGAGIAGSLSGKWASLKLFSMPLWKTEAEELTTQHAVNRPQ